MYAKLVAITKPLTEGVDTPEDFVVYAARVSSPQNQLNMETGGKLIKYLIAHKHWSPFEQVSATVEIETSRAIAAQLLRHRSFVFQEQSQRYTASTSVEQVNPRRQDYKNRQASHDDLPAVTVAGFNAAMEQVWAMAKHAYDEAIAMGIAKESARFLLPLATTTRMYVTGSLRSFIHYLQVRLDTATQLEHRELALNIKSVLEPVFPLTFKEVFNDGQT